MWRSPYVWLLLYTSVKYIQSFKKIYLISQKLLTNRTKCAIIIYREAQRPELTN